MDTDVVIIGGGPAGLCTGIEMAQAGISVVLLEKKSFPIDKPCGEGLMPEGVAHLQRLGVMEYLDATNYSIFNGISFINKSQSEAKSLFNLSFGLGIRRKALSEAIYARALKEPNLNIYSSTQVLSIEHKDHYVRVLSDQNNFRARLIIGADGLRSHVRRWANLDHKTRKTMRYGLRRHFALKPWNSNVEVSFAPGLEAYVTPCGSSQVNLTFLWDKNIHTKVCFNNFVKYFPMIYERIKDANFLSEELATGPLEHGCKAPVTDGIALVGDASGYLDAITGEGNSIAMSEAKALARVVYRALSSGNKILTKEQLMPYARAHKNIVKNYYRNTRLLLYIAKYPRLMDNFIEWGSKYPKAFSYVINKSRPATATTYLVAGSASTHFLS